MSDIHIILTDDNQPVIAFTNEVDAVRYIESQKRGSTLMPPRNDLRAMKYPVWRSFDKLRTAMQKVVDPSWGVDNPNPAP